MAKQKYKFERLTPIDNMDLDVYEEAIDYAIYPAGGSNAGP